MGVKVRLYRGAWWVFITHRGRRKAKRVGDRDSARRVAHATLRRVFPNHARSDAARESQSDGAGQRATRTRFGPAWRPEEDGSWRDELCLLIAEESVQHLDDLMLRRTSLGDDPRTAREVATRVCEVFDWDASRRELELQRLERCLDDAAAVRE